MALRMARPIRLTANGFLVLKERVPADVLPKVRGLKISLPVGELKVSVKVGEFVQTSLRTKDDRQAKERHAQADAALRALWDAHRRGPRSLSQRERIAIAGEFYTSLIAKHEDEPGGSEEWLKAEANSLIARVSRFDPKAGLAIPDKDRLQRDRLFKLYAEPLSDLLSSKGMVVDEVSRDALLRELGSAFEQAARHLRSNAEGDYRPDPDADRFPEWRQPTENLNASGKRLTVAALAKLFLKAQGGRMAANTLKRYAPSLASFGAFMKNRDAAAVTSDDVYEWAQHRRDNEKISAGTVNRNDLVALSSMFVWASERDGGRVVSQNPVAKDTRLKENRKVRTRTKDFRESEVRAILRAATEVAPGGKNPTAAAAYRWCPWLAAYSGARISELTGLLGSDIRTEDGVTIMDFTNTKTGVPRSVPIHDHVLDQGFLDYARGRGDLPLFYDPARHEVDSKTPPAEVRSRKVANWVRKTTGLDMDVKANHGWRNTWKTRATEAGIEEMLRDAITGHAETKVGRAYVQKSVGLLGRAMKRFPRYEVG